MSAVRQRGALLEGNPPSSIERRTVTSGGDDLESGSHAPDTDYASQPPRDIWQQTPISSEDIRYHVDRHNQQPESSKTQIKKSVFVALAITTLIVVGAVITVGVVVFGKKSNGGGGASNGQILTNRQQLLSDIISTISSSQTLAEPESPQSMARTWLLFEDALWLNPESGTPRRKVIQRYSLAVFYYSTNGPSSWGNSNWLIGDECEGDNWDGLNCNDNGEVRTLALGKSMKMAKIIAINQRYSRDKNSPLDRTTRVSRNLTRGDWSFEYDGEFHPQES